MVLEDPCERVVQCPTQGLATHKLKTSASGSFQLGVASVPARIPRRACTEVEETSLLYRVVCKVAAGCGALRGLWRDGH